MSNTNLNTAPETAPAGPDKKLGDVVPMAYDIAALGRMVRDVGLDAFAKDALEENLSRLCALGLCIDKLAREIAERVDEFDTPSVRRLLSEEPQS